jgi:hypothetical protein
MFRSFLSTFFIPFITRPPSEAANNRGGMNKMLLCVPYNFMFLGIEIDAATAAAATAAKAIKCSNLKL